MKQATREILLDKEPMIEMCFVKPESDEQGAAGEKLKMELETLKVSTVSHEAGTATDH
jgi:hypothetical protein